MTPVRCLLLIVTNRTHKEPAEWVHHRKPWHSDQVHRQLAILVLFNSLRREREGAHYVLCVHVCVCAGIQSRVCRNVLHWIKSSLNEVIWLTSVLVLGMGLEAPQMVHAVDRACCLSTRSNIFVLISPWDICCFWYIYLILFFCCFVLFCYSLLNDTVIHFFLHNNSCLLWPLLGNPCTLFNFA